MTTLAPYKEIRLRACAIILRERRILLSRALENPFWELPGGRVEAGEMSARALVRELREELGVPAARMGPLVLVVENKFAHGGRRLHELCLVYEASLTEAEWPMAKGEVEGAEPDLRFCWFALGNLAAVDLRPRPLRDRLAGDVPAQIVHLQVDELED